MHTIPTATTSTIAQAQPPGAAKAGSDASIFAALIQALTCAPPAAAAPATAAPGKAGGEAGAPTTEGGADGPEGEGLSETDMPALVQLPGLELPVPPLPLPSMPAGGAAAAGAGAPAAQSVAATQPAAAAPVPPPVSAAEPQAAVPPSAQAMELAKVLPAGTQVHVTADAAAPTPPPAPAANTVAVALALQEAPAAAAARPLIRTVAPEPKRTSPAGVETANTASAPEPAAASAAKPGAPAQPKADPAPAPAAAGADGGPAAPPSGSAPHANAEAAAQEPAPGVAKGHESQAGAGQAPAFASTASAQPAAATPERAAPVPLPAPPPAGQVSVHIAKAVRTGVDRIDIQLAPASLGRVEISLDLSDSQQVRASISAETKEALELLRADARLLERALNDAGLKTDPGSLSFQLRDQGARAGHDGGSRQGHGAQPQGGQREDPEVSRGGEALAPVPAPPASRSQGRIDIHA